jgi:hypothetical protein
MSLEAGIGAGSLERPLASLGVISYNPLAFPSDFYSLPLFSGYIHFYDSGNAFQSWSLKKIHIGVFCLLFM